MADDHPLPPQPDTGFPPAPEQDRPHGEAEHEHHTKKHKNKVRSAWISFIGRIIAQVAGAMATIILGLAVINQYGASRAKSGVPADDRTVAAPAALRQVDLSHSEIDLAVLPFENLSGDPAQEYLADGMTESLIGNLSQVDGLHVISRTSSMHYKSLRKPLPEVAAELAVDLVVEGSVARQNGRIRVIAQLINTATDQELWSRTYDRPSDDSLALQADVSAAIAREVRTTVTPEVWRRPAGQARIDPALYEQYIRGRHAAGIRTAPELRTAVHHFETAVGIDPSFAPAYAGLANAHVLLALSLDSSAMRAGELVLAREAAAKAVRLDPGLAEAHAALAVVFQRLDWDWNASDQAYRRAIALRPGDAMAHSWYAVLLSEQGRHREALAQAELAVELDPLLADAHGTLALVHYFAGRYDRAVPAGRRAIQLDPASVSGRLVLAWSLLEQGDAAGAIAVCEARPWPDGLDQMLATLADANRRRGSLARAEEVRRELLGLNSASPAALARLYISRSETEAAFGVLDQAARQRLEFIRAARVDPLFSRIRRDPRFAAVLARLNSGDGQ